MHRNPEIHTHLSPLFLVAEIPIFRLVRGWNGADDPVSPSDVSAASPGPTMSVSRTETKAQRKWIICTTVSFSMGLRCRTGTRLQRFNRLLLRTTSLSFRFYLSLSLITLNCNHFINYQLINGIIEPLTYSLTDLLLLYFMKCVETNLQIKHSFIKQIFTLNALIKVIIIIIIVVWLID